MNYSKRHFVKFSDRTCRRPGLRTSPGPDGTNGQHVITSSVIMRRYEAADVGVTGNHPHPSVSQWVGFGTEIGHLQNQDLHRPVLLSHYSEHHGNSLFSLESRKRPLPAVGDCQLNAPEAPHGRAKWIPDAPVGSLQLQFYLQSVSTNGSIWAFISEPRAAVIFQQRVFSWSQGDSRQVQGGAISQKAVSGPPAVQVGDKYAGMWTAGPWRVYRSLSQAIMLTLFSASNLGTMPWAGQVQHCLLLRTRVAHP